MYDFHDLVTPGSVLADVSASTRKALFGQVATVAEQVFGHGATGIVELLNDREKLGTTAFGNGIAIPHARVDGLVKVYGIFVRTRHPVDYGAIDDLPVDLVFALFSPRDAGADHLKSLARVSRALRDAPFRAKLRGAGSADALYALLSGVEARDAA